jgi:hypothetical protein
MRRIRQWWRCHAQGPDAMADILMILLLAVFVAAAAAFAACCRKL